MRLSRDLRGAAWRRARIRQSVPAPSGKTYLLQVAPSGFVQWSRGGVQGPIEWLYTRWVSLVNRLVFWGSWSVVAWEGDEIAPQRKKILTRRFRSEQEATDSLETLATTITRAGPPDS
jgi:hypothetical protein